MPIGSAHDETGVIGSEAGQLILWRDDGGRWRLDAPHDAGRHLGKRVRVTGIRSGFDLLDVQTITLAE